MTRAIVSLVGLCLLAACATEPGPSYRIGATGVEQDRTSAERLLAEQAVTRFPTSVDTPPQVVSTPFPGYPQGLRRSDIKGEVLVHYTIDADGSVGNPWVAGTPPAELAALALEAIRRWKFKPAMNAGQPVAVRVRQLFDFRLVD
jgi:protein TonB